MANSRLRANHIKTGKRYFRRKHDKKLISRTDSKSYQPTLSHQKWKTTKVKNNAFLDEIAFHAKEFKLFSTPRRWLFVCPVWHRPTNKIWLKILKVPSIRLSQKEALSKLLKALSVKLDSWWRIEICIRWRAYVYATKHESWKTCWGCVDRDSKGLG